MRQQRTCLLYTSKYKSEDVTGVEYHIENSSQGNCAFKRSTKKYFQKEENHSKKKGGNKRNQSADNVKLKINHIITQTTWKST